MSILPFQNNSITRRWMEHEHTNQQAALLYIATGCLAAIAGYYKKNAFPVLGTGSLLIDEFLSKETPFSGNTPLKDLTYPTPIKMIHFITFCSFLGLSLRQSWTKAPSAPPPTKWTPFLLKAPLYLAAFYSLTNCCLILGETIIKKLDEGTNSKVLAVSILVLLAALTYLVPRFYLFAPFLAYIATIRIGLQAFAQQETLKKALHAVEKPFQIIQIMMVGSLVGLLLRYVIGPKDHTPTLPLKAKIPLWTLISILIAELFVLQDIVKDGDVLRLEETSKWMLENLFSSESLERLVEMFESLKEEPVLKKDNPTYSEFEALEEKLKQSFPEVSIFIRSLPLLLVQMGIMVGVPSEKTLNEMQAFLNQVLDGNGEN